MKELALRDDMGSDNYLKITMEDDGDIIISISKIADKFNAPKVQFCASGTAHPGAAAFFREFMKRYPNWKTKSRR